MTEEEEARIKAIVEELEAMHEKNKAIRYLFCYDRGDKSAVARIGTDRDMANFIGAFLRSDEDAQNVVMMALVTSKYEHSSEG